MNHYGQLAMTHWQRHRPGELEKVQDPTAFFTELGDQVQEAVTTTRDAILARNPTSDPVELGKRTRQATATAEELALTDLVLHPEEPTAQPADESLEAHYRALDEANRVINEQP